MARPKIADVAIDVVGTFIGASLYHIVNTTIVAADYFERIRRNHKAPYEMDNLP